MALGSLTSGHLPLLGGGLQASLLPPDRALGGAGGAAVTSYFPGNEASQGRVKKANTIFGGRRKMREMTNLISQTTVGRWTV